MSNLKIITGHYGSGKTEFCLNYAINSAKQGLKVWLVDIDIVNPYFRSREQANVLESNGVVLVGSSIANTADLPALPREIYGLIDQEDGIVIFDVGGDANGARVLSRYSSLISRHEYDLYIVINANRPFTQTADQAISYINAIEEQSRLEINGLINTTHLLRETTIDDIVAGQKLCEEIEKLTGKPLIYNVIPDFSGINKRDSKDYIIKLYMRPAWL